MACRICTAWIGKIASSGTVSRLWTVPLATNTVCALALKHLNKEVSDFANQSSSAVLLNP